ncbi:MAG: hypothetical protein KDA32_06685, partial [Phycisphaerales bacterium]|nr:hypothetical protein [Phycisphaerales bacterium]
PSGPSATLDPNNSAGSDTQTTDNPNSTNNPDGPNATDPNGNPTSDPNSGDPGVETPVDPVVPAASGKVYLGDISCTITQKLDDTQTDPKSDTLEIEVSFDTEGKSSGFLVFGFSGSPDVFAPIIQVGESTTETTSSNNLDVTMEITIREALYSADAFRLVFDVDYDGQGGSLTQKGTGVLTVNGLIANGTLRYTAEMDYLVDLTAGGLKFKTGESRVCEGALGLQ